MLISATTGQENFPEATSKFHVFFVPTRERMGKEVPLGMMAKGANPDVPVTISGAQYIPAMTNYPETLGKWTNARYDVPEGVVLKIFAHRKGRMVPTDTAAIYIQLRSGAALRRLSCDTLRHAKGARDAVHYEGRFDVLTLQQMAQLGISLNPQMMGLLDPRKQAAMFRETVLDRETAGRVSVRTRQVKNSEGKTVAVSRPTTARAVRL